MQHDDRDVRIVAAQLLEGCQQSAMESASIPAAPFASALLSDQPYSGKELELGIKMPSSSAFLQQKQQQPPAPHHHAAHIKSNRHLPQPLSCLSADVDRPLNPLHGACNHLVQAHLEGKKCMTAFSAEQHRPPLRSVLPTVLNTPQPRKNTRHMPSKKARHTQTSARDSRASPSTGPFHKQLNKGTNAKDENCDKQPPHLRTLQEVLSPNSLLHHASLTSKFPGESS